MVPRLARRFPFASGNLAFHRRRCHGCRSSTACRPLTAASCACTPCSGKTQLSVHTKKARLVSQRQETRTGERMIVRAATLPASAAASLLRILASRGLPTRLNSAITKPSFAILCRCGGRGAVVSTLQQAQHKADQQLQPWRHVELGFLVCGPLQLQFSSLGRKRRASVSLPKCKAMSNE